MQMEARLRRIPRGSALKILNVRGPGKSTGSHHGARRARALNGWLRAVGPALPPGFGCATRFGPGEIVKMLKSAPRRNVWDGRCVFASSMKHQSGCSAAKKFASRMSAPFLNTSAWPCAAKAGADLHRVGRHFSSPLQRIEGCPRPLHGRRQQILSSLLEVLSVVQRHVPKLMHTPTPGPELLHNSFVEAVYPRGTEKISFSHTPQWIRCSASTGHSHFWQSVEAAPHVPESGLRYGT